MFGFPEQVIKGELALVTGGGGGLGRLLALRLSKLGVDIVIWDINQEGESIWLGRKINIKCIIIIQLFTKFKTNTQLCSLLLLIAHPQNKY